ncbi:MAG: NUDIX hydrolase [Limnobacter sp.]|nr:NUDIX hydrolase [Limnobacter sp.]
MKFCCRCGTAVEHKIPEGDNRERACCPACGEIHYVNPKIVVGTIPMFEDKVLLCKRAIEPRYGFWTLPAGFMELNETTMEGAKRETWEEARAEVELEPLFTAFDVIRADQVHLFYRATMREAKFDAGPESLDVKLFSYDEIPWDELAFKTVSTSLKLFFEDQAKGFFGVHTGDIYDHISWAQDDFFPKPKP